jgi:hypothetical protein
MNKDQCAAMVETLDREIKHVQEKMDRSRGDFHKNRALEVSLHIMGALREGFREAGKWT